MSETPAAAADKQPEVDPRDGAGLIKRIITAPHKKVTEPEKEIRFTRTSQATFFLFLAIFSIMLCIGTLFNEFVNWGPWHTDFKAYWWLSLIPLIPAALFFRIGIHCARHAYIILTPMGVEIFPFWKPEKNLQVIFWSDIDHAEFKGHQMILHYNEEETAGVVTSLKPIGKKNYPLLEKAINGRLSDIANPETADHSNNIPGLQPGAKTTFKSKHSTSDRHGTT